MKYYVAIKTIGVDLLQRHGRIVFHEKCAEDSMCDMISDYKTENSVCVY